MTIANPYSAPEADLQTNQRRNLADFSTKELKKLPNRSSNIIGLASAASPTWKQAWADRLVDVLSEGLKKLSPG